MIEARAAVIGGSTAGISKTVTNRSPVSCGSSGCLHAKAFLAFGCPERMKTRQARQSKSDWIRKTLLAAANGGKNGS